ncbi:MAG: DUF1214 domain-containing protein [Gammaproteobacteria bacterium]|nr:DUF1214 domain-containing protein [Gammaproteobacteria bacterium]
MSSQGLSASHSPLATAHQAEVERTALGLLQRPDIKLAHLQAKALFLADPVAMTPAGSRTLDQAVDECVLTAIYDTILSDVSTPRIIWIESPPHSWFGHTIGGARYFNDNPDCAIRAASLDPVGSYEIHGRAGSVRQAALSFQLYHDNAYGLVIPGVPSRSSSREKFDTALGGLFDDSLQVAPDGSYTITLDPAPARGRANHIQTQQDACALLIRSVLSDWATETPDWLEIRRTDQPSKRVVPTGADLAAQIIQRLKVDVPFWLKANHFFGPNNPPNLLPTPQSRGGGWGYASFGNYRLGPDEALLITIHPSGARYTGFVVTNPWSISCEHIRHTGSLNGNQTRPNADGSYTYVICATDPGVANWLDTGGLDIGNYFVRWMNFPELPSSGDDLVREVTLVKLADLDQILPRDMPRLTPVQRAREMNTRARTFERRLVHQQ